MQVEAIMIDFHGSEITPEELDDALIGWTPLTRLVCIAFDAEPEMVEFLKSDGPDESFLEDWLAGPCYEFVEYFDLDVLV